MSNLVNVLSMWNLWKNKPNTPLYGSRYSYFQFFIIKIFFLKQEMVETILVSMFHVILSAYWDRTPIFSHIIEPCRKKQIFLNTYSDNWGQSTKGWKWVLNVPKGNFSSSQWTSTLLEEWVLVANSKGGAEGISRADFIKTWKWNK